MKILLDTNFVLTCIKQKIDFETLANEILDGKIEWIIPLEVLKEIEKFKDKVLSKKSLEFLDKLKPQIIKLEGNSPNVDQKIARYIYGEKIILATLDKGLKSKVNNPILSIRGKKMLKLLKQ